MKKPRAKLIGADSNIFNLLGIANGVLRKAGQKDQMIEMTNRVWAAQSYDEALVVIGEYVDIY